MEGRRTIAFTAKVCALWIGAMLAVSVSAQMKDYGNRVEGTAYHPQNAKSYEILGFFAHREAFPLTDGIKLRLSFFQPDQKVKAFVSANELRVEKQYEMKAKTITLRSDGWSEFSDWPVSVVLKPNKITADNLGVVVRLGNDNEANEELAPVVLVSTAQGPAAIREYTLYLKADKQLRSVDFQVTAEGFKKTFHYREGQRNRAVEENTVIPLNFPAVGIPMGPVTIEIRAPIANSLNGVLTPRVQFYHKPL